ncbi:MAG: transglutaminase family protein [Candidatus Promineifilaceae bacterium]
MIYEALSKTYRRLGPAEGWLSVFLLLAIAYVVVAAVLAVEWTAEDSVVALAAILGLLLAAVLAKRPTGWPLAWVLILAYGLTLTTIRLSQLWPPVAVMTEGWEPVSAYIRQNWALFVDRISGWLRAISGGGRSEETIVFSFGLGLLAWLVFAFLAWSTYRQRRPLVGLTVVAFALAINTYYGNAPLWPAALFVGLAALLASLVHFADLEQSWSNKGIDYSQEIRMDLLLASGGISLILLSVSFIVPEVDLRAISQAVLDRPGVHEAEEAFGRVFAGVQQPQPEMSHVGRGLGAGPGASASLPRTFLLGGAPELYETVVMTAAVAGSTPPATHWRGLSYDVYTGQGWAVSTERQEPIPAGQLIPLPVVMARTPITQTVQWVLGNGQTRFTLGRPQRFDQEVVVFWRGLDDLSRVVGQSNRYAANSLASSADPALLRQATLEDVPPAIMARYTRLPESIPERVLSLAEEVAGDPAANPTPYDQVRSLERFLRQYPYSLDVELPPANVDPVDYFLFELQTGYCDYYASSMVVLARSLGLPARLATGFLAQPPEDGFQTIYAINAHSWAEIYFAGLGWIEFEPTAGFPSSETPGAAPSESGPQFEQPDTGPPLPIPPRATPGPSPLWALVLLPLVVLGWWLWRLRRDRLPTEDRVIWAYGRLQRSALQLGQPVPASQTPAEFQSAFTNRLQEFSQQKLANRLNLAQLYPEIERVTASFVARQYGGRQPPADVSLAAWRRIRTRLWFLRLFDRMRRLFTGRPSQRPRGMA